MKWNVTWQYYRLLNWRINCKGKLCDIQQLNNMEHTGLDRSFVRCRLLRRSRLLRLVETSTEWSHIHREEAYADHISREDWWNLMISLICRDSQRIEHQEYQRSPVEPIHRYTLCDNPTYAHREVNDVDCTGCLINISGRSTYSSVHCTRQSRSSVEQSSIARHCCKLSLHLLLSS